MKKVLINYADNKYRKAQYLCTLTGNCLGGFDEVFEYNPSDIDAEFKKINDKILSISRGGGLWLWKPYIIYKKLQTLSKGDYLFYCDSGAVFVRSVEHVIERMDQDIFVADLPLIEEQYTKNECFYIMDAMKDSYKKTNQIQASYLCIRKSDFSLDFVEKWLDLCCDYKLISPSENENEINLFIAHREDQSILSLLCKKNKILPHKDISQYGRFPKGYASKNAMFKVACHPLDKYKPIIVHHRCRYLKTFFLKQFFIAFCPEIILKFMNKCKR